MKNQNPQILFFALALFLFGCKTHWSTAVNYGSVPSITFEQNIDIEINSNLIFLPVEIGGHNYRFLFDSGAPCSISKELKEKSGFKNLRSGQIRDTDNNRAPIEWVLVDSLVLGSVIFENQPAFVGDFTANPALACLNIDGIIGSNNIKFCNWIIDTQKNEMTLTNAPIDPNGTNGFWTNFTYDRQYNINLDLEVGNVTLKKVHLDFGSNGSLSITRAQFDTLVSYNLLDSVFVQSGVKQTGIVGKITNTDTQISRIDSLEIGGIRIQQVELNTGTSKLLGNRISSKHRVTTDSDNRKLYFQPYKIVEKDLGNYGFQPGYSDSLNIYIQSVTTGSTASQVGLKANMQILNIDTLDFENKHNICDYMKFADLTKSSSKSIKLRVKTPKGEIMEVMIERQPLFK